MLITAQNVKSDVRFGKSDFLPFDPAVITAFRNEEIIGIDEIRSAAHRIRPYIKRTPLFFDENLSERFNSNFYLKHELLQKTGAHSYRQAAAGSAEGFVKCGGQ